MRPELITSISDALQQISTLTVANANLSESLSRERITFGKIIYDLNNQLEEKQEENAKLNRYLHQAQEIMLDQEHLIKELEDKIIALERANTEMRQRAEEGLKKGWQLQELCDMLLGKKSEKFVPVARDIDVAIQQTLGAEFDILEIEEIIKVAISPSDIRQTDQEIVKTSRKKKRYEAHKGRRVQPSWLEVVTETIDITIDKTGLKPMGKKVTTYYDYQPGKIIKIQQEHLQYISEDKKIICEPVKPRLVEKGTVGNRLLAHLHTRRFAYGDPYYRQLKFIKNTTGVSFATSTVDGWEANAFRKLGRLLRCLKKVIMQSKYIKADETRLRYLNDVGKGKPSNGWLWVFLSPEHKLVLFEFNPSRGQIVPGEILKDFKGILQTDGLASYTAAFKNNDQVTMMSCLVHIRRGFKKAEASDKKLVAEVLTLFNVIYRIEAYADRKKFTPEQRLPLRQKYSVPFLDKIKSWLLQQQGADHLPGTPVYKAINYALGQWDRLKAFTENGNVEPDNNGVERAIRPVTIFRKNSMFAGNEHGAQRVALFYSLIESCKLNDIDPFTYLCDIYDRLHDCPANQLINLLPHYWKKQE
ncbi:IS66 family transposase [Chitinophaga sp. S165]|uniref:IS66 family transposase n=1 Tax=Chitinophaga sp. S165 TaxID=2135462 RepID=UPI000D90EF84|nr:IS66 family transposase [Chitinophaga sp. S165]PWV44394.1 transposase IS66-like protein [Chitinophaga sp. S165]